MVQSRTLWVWRCSFILERSLLWVDGFSLDVAGVKCFCTFVLRAECCFRGAFNKAGQPFGLNWCISSVSTHCWRFSHVDEVNIVLKQWNMMQSAQIRATGEVFVFDTRRSSTVRNSFPINFRKIFIAKLSHIVPQILRRLFGWMSYLRLATLS
jgi:hypothetical protein